MKKVAMILLVIAGLYFVFDHTDPLPLNHEAIGLGVNHIAHSIFGIVLFIPAGFLWFKGRRSSKD